MSKFKKEVLDKIKSDVALFAAVATKMDVKPTTLAATIDRNGNNLNQYSIVTLVAEFLDVKPEDLLEEESEVRESQS